MDISKEYIEMCLKGVEIQGSWEPKIGDLTDNGLVVGAWSSGAINYIPYGGITHTKPKGDFIWLPRQDQLQDMVPNEPVWDYRFSKFSNWLDIEPGLTIFNSVDSMEQLWLAFVMHEKYDKKWLKNQWIKK